MSGWTAKRFWSTVEVVGEAGGHTVRLDGRPIRTPGKAPLILPTRALAQAVADEWAAQEDQVHPQTMPMTRTANSAIDKVAPHRSAVVDHLLDYGGTDLLCYRADGPEALVRRQAAAWDLWLDWADGRYGARLRATTGVVPVAQEPAALAALRLQLDRLSPFELAAVHDLVALSGSLVLGLAIADDAGDPAAIWEASRLDETFQIEQWGWDAEAEQAAGLKRAAFLGAARFRELARPGA